MRGAGGAGLLTASEESDRRRLLLDVVAGRSNDVDGLAEAAERQHVDFAVGHFLQPAYDAMVIDEDLPLAAAKVGLKPIEQGYFILGFQST